MFKKFSLILIFASTTLFSMQESKHTPEELAEIKNKVFDVVKEHKEDFNRIRDEKKPIEIAWREMVSISVPMSKGVISQYGYPDTYAGTQQFSLEYILAQANRPDLAQINEALYDFMYLETFGETGETKAIPQEEARAIVGQAAQNVDSEQSQKELEEIKKLSEPLQKIIAAGVFTYQLAHEAGEKFGFSKDAVGFIDVQRALTAHYADPVIMTTAFTMIHKIYAIVGVDVKK